MKKLVMVTYNILKYLDPKIWKGGFGPANPKLDPVFSDLS